jgi:hypothetical protein
MDPAQRIVTSTPLSELWDDCGLLDAHRVVNAAEADIVQLLRDGASFVVAEVGQPLRWISQGDRFSLWKDEVKSRLVRPCTDRFSPNDYPSNYCYVATVWRCGPSGSVIVLEKHH